MALCLCSSDVRSSFRCVRSSSKVYKYFRCVLVHRCVYVHGFVFMFIGCSQFFSMCSQFIEGL